MHNNVSSRLVREMNDRWLQFAGYCRFDELDKRNYGKKIGKKKTRLTKYGNCIIAVRHGVYFRLWRWAYVYWWTWCFLTERASGGDHLD
ncbi:MAG TPA: hypothetical protein DEF45_10115 [Rhodopirellula sp.]|nr:hypothetical protein [Rhodopirellula sp.]